MFGKPVMDIRKSIKIFVLFIISLFSFNLVTAQALVASTPASKGYMLRPGDEIEGKVSLEPQFDFKAVVDENGLIEVAFA